MNARPSAQIIDFAARLVTRKTAQQRCTGGRRDAPEAPLIWVWGPEEAAPDFFFDSSAGQRRDKR